MSNYKIDKPSKVICNIIWWLVCWLVYIFVCAIKITIVSKVKYITYKALLRSVLIFPLCSVLAGRAELLSEV